MRKYIFYIPYRNSICNASLITKLWYDIPKIRYYKYLKLFVSYRPKSISQIWQVKCLKFIIRNFSPKYNRDKKKKKDKLEVNWACRVENLMGLTWQKFIFSVNLIGRVGLEFRNNPFN